MCRDMKGKQQCGAVSSRHVEFGPLSEAAGPLSQVINHIQDYTLHLGARQSSLTHLTYGLQLNNTFKGRS